MTATLPPVAAAPRRALASPRVLPVLATFVLFVAMFGAGSLRYDNYGGNWGDQKLLDRFQQAYAVEKACLESRKQGHGVVEQALADGSVKLTITVGGAS